MNFIIIQKLKKNKTEQKFDVEPLYDKAPSTKEEVLKIKNELFEKNIHPGERGTILMNSYNRR